MGPAFPRRRGRAADATPRRILVVKLAGIGDLLLSTPALRTLRAAFPEAAIDLLVPPGCLDLLQTSALVDRVIPFEKYAFDDLRSVLSPPRLLRAARFLRELRRQGYDTVLFLHHLITLWGTLKYALLAAACGAKVRAGLDNGRGWFLTHRAKDRGFGWRHEAEYAAEVVATLGAATRDWRLEVPITPADRQQGGERLRAALTRAGLDLGGGNDAPLVAIHPAVGGYAPGRAWSVSAFAQVAAALSRQGARVVSVGGSEDLAAGHLLAKLSRAPLADLTGRVSVRQLAAVLAECDLFIGADSGVMHLAAAVGAPLVAIFGPSNHQAWGPLAADPGAGSASPARAAVVRRDLLCSPCLYRGHQVGLRWGCPERVCLMDLDPEVVLAAARQLLAGEKRLAAPLGPHP